MADKKKAMADLKKIYILHGWAYSTEKWNDFTRLLNYRGLSSVILNIPGLTEETDKVWALPDYVEWLKKKTAGEQVTLIGHSNGGRIALAFGLKYPELTRQLVLIDSAGIRPNGFVIRAKRFVFKTLAKFGKKINSSEKLRSMIYKLARERDYPDATPQMRETMANLISVDLKPELAKINTPTLIIWGEKDKSTPLADGIIMNKNIKGSKLHIIKGARHSPQFTHTEEVVNIITSEIA